MFTFWIQQAWNDLAVVDIGKSDGITADEAMVDFMFNPESALAQCHSHILLSNAGHNSARIKLTLRFSRCSS